MQPLLLLAFVELPSLRRLRVNWDQRLSTEAAHRIAKALFAAHEEAMQLKDQLSTLVHISFCDNHRYTCTHNFARLILPIWNSKSDAGVGEWQAVKMPDDELLDWSWGSAYRTPEYGT